MLRVQHIRGTRRQPKRALAREEVSGRVGAEFFLTRTGGAQQTHDGPHLPWACRQAANQASPKLWLQKTNMYMADKLFPRTCNCVSTRMAQTCSPGGAKTIAPLQVAVCTEAHAASVS